ncbi:hypothetical protein CK203_033059 [Vitis vinifera]|uniref:Uncharacterized protein n=1 Tax=Vitis vinifera TaxID=29760 RepID=A0A438HVX6_VITVI|nr:hypothetical protein CK203_092974 [Vitis vinifera]RVW88598.1 hypothetical protein CK203_033059 [Vitis vinifera]
MLCFRNFLSAPGVCTFLDMNLHPGMRDHGMVVLTRKSSELAAQPILLERSLFSADNKTDNLELGDTAKLRALIDSGAEVSFFNGEGLTPLMHAARLGHADAVKILIETDVPWNALSPSNLFAGISPWIPAAKKHSKSSSMPGFKLN